jgi:hypothetical protein
VQVRQQQGSAELDEPLPIDQPDDDRDDEDGQRRPVQDPDLVGVRRLTMAMLLSRTPGILCYCPTWPPLV